MQVCCFSGHAWDTHGQGCVACFAERALIFDQRLNLIRVAQGRPLKVYLFPGYLHFMPCTPWAG